MRPCHELAPKAATMPKKTIPLPPAEEKLVSEEPDLEVEVLEEAKMEEEVEEVERGMEGAIVLAPPPEDPCTL